MSNPNLSQAKEYIKEYENGKYYQSVAAASQVVQPPSAIEAVEKTEDVEAVEASERTKSNKEEKDNPFSDPNVVIAIVTAVPTILIGYWQYGKKNNAKSE